MKGYPLKTDQQDLTLLPDLIDSPGYEVLQGNPQASIRLDKGTGNSKNRLGIWMCTPGSFKCIEKGDELQTVLEGKLILIDDAGNEQHLGPGDSVFTEKGQAVTWCIVETVKKVFFTYDSDGD